MCNKYYAVGAKIVSVAVNESISNATINATCAAVKSLRGAEVNTYHTAILALLAGGYTGWTPASEPTLFGHWIAGSPGQTLDANSSVTFLDDQSTNNNNLTNSNQAGIGPIYTDTTFYGGNTALNTYPGIGFPAAGYNGQKFSGTFPAFNSATFSIGFVFQPKVSDVQIGSTFQRYWSIKDINDQFDYNGVGSLDFLNDTGTTPYSLGIGGGMLGSSVSGGELSLTAGSVDNFPQAHLFVCDGSTLKWYVNGTLQQTINCTNKLAPNGFELTIGTTDFQWATPGMIFGELFITKSVISPVDFMAYADNQWGLGQTTDLLLVAGQSNAVGFNLGQADVPPDLQTIDPYALIWTGSAWTPLHNGFNNDLLCTSDSNTSWAMETEFARAYRLANPHKKLAIIKYAVSGTALQWEGSGLAWDSTITGNLFDNMTTNVTNGLAAAPAAGLTLNPRWLIWMQGETDATNSDAANAYQSNLTALVAKARTHWGNAQTKILVGRIRADTGGSAGVVRSGEAAFVNADGNAAMIDTDSYPRQNDNLHYTAAGQVQFGDDCFAVG